jgi:hypothetical protein
VELLDHRLNIDLAFIERIVASKFHHVICTVEYREVFELKKYISKSFNRHELFVSDSACVKCLIVFHKFCFQFLNIAVDSLQDFDEQFVSLFLPLESSLVLGLRFEEFFDI